MRLPVLHLAVTLLISFGVFWGPAVQESLAGPTGPTGYFAVQSFDWKEYAEDTRAVRETGPLFSIGLSYPVVLGDRLQAISVAELFGGPMDYNGHACDVTGGDCEASTADVNYFGVKVEGDLRVSVPSGSFSFEPFGGLGFRYWSRHIEPGSTASGIPTSSFSEDWVTLYVRGGMRGAAALSGGRQVFVLAGAKLPFFTQNTAHTAEVGQGPDMDLRPGKQVSFFAEAGMNIERLSVSLFYDSLRYPQSPTVSNGFAVGYQPRSTLDLYGLKAGWTF